MDIKPIEKCRLCGAKELSSVIDLGPQLLATTFVSDENESKIPMVKVPLTLVRCDQDKNQDSCGLVQLQHTFPAELMYQEYWYLSGVNQTMRDALADITRQACNKVQLNSGDIVVDIGCNDGTLLNSYKKSEIDKVGFDPAQNVGDIENESFLRVRDFFNIEAYKKAKGDKKAKIVTSIAMFYDLDNPATFTSDVANILDENGVWIIQMADLPNMLENNMFDNICHEHLCYYHLAPMEKLLNDHGLELVDIEKNDINGSSYRLYISKKGSSLLTSESKARLDKIRDEEEKLKLNTDAPYATFCENVEKNKIDLLELVNKANNEGKKVFVYGASTKGNVLLQYYDINANMIPYALERNPNKWGMKTIGTNIPIISEEEGRKMNPDYLLVLPYHFMAEMLPREKEYTDAGGKFIIPVPTIHTVP